MCKKIIKTDKAPKAIGPYSQAVINNGLIFVSGQLPINPSTGKIADGIEAQTEQCLENIKAIIIGAKSSLDNILKVNIFIANMNDFKKVNEIYSKYFSDNYPARACVEVSKLPMNAQIEIEVIATV